VYNKIYVTTAYHELVGHMLETLCIMYSFEQHYQVIMA